MANLLLPRHVVSVACAAAVAVAVSGLLGACSSSSDGSPGDGSGAGTSGGATGGDSGSPSSTGTTTGSTGSGDAGSGQAATGTDGGATLDGAADGAATQPPTGAPAAPANFLLTAQAQNALSLQWHAATAGDHPVDHYKIYRNGTSYATSMGTTYTDSAATDAISPDCSGPVSVYTYAVSAVDTAGKEGALQSKLTYWMYNTNTTVDDNPAAGIGGIAGNFVAGNFSCGTPVMNDTDGDPTADPSQPGGSPYDFKFSGCGYNQPYSGPPTVPEWALSLAPFKYVVVDIKLTKAEPMLGIDIISRVPPGDEFNHAGLGLVDGTYGPVPVVGQWATYKVPLTALAIGTVQFEGKVSGNLLTVTSFPSGGAGADAGAGAVVSIQNSMWITGQGIPAGTYIAQAGPYDDQSCATGQANCGTGGTGTYLLATPNNAMITVPDGTTLTGQRYDNYRMPINVSTNDLYYINNIGFTSE